MFTLTRPLIQLDTETTGTDPENDRIIELGFKIYYHDDRPSVEWESLIRPGIPILNTDFNDGHGHGITDEKVNACKTCGNPQHEPTDHEFLAYPSFKQLAPRLAVGFVNCDFCAYNGRFDLRVLQAEFTRAGVSWSSVGAFLLDSSAIWRKMKPRTLTDAVREFLGREPSDAHRAAGDAQDAYDVLLSQIERFDLPWDIQKLHEMCFDTDNVDPDGKFVWKNGIVLCNFGKHKGTALDKVPKSYWLWCVQKGNFPLDAKKIMSDAVAGKFPQRI